MSQDMTSPPGGLLGDLTLSAAHLRKRAHDAYIRLRWPNAAPKDVPPETLPDMGSIVEIDGIKMRIDPRMSPFNIRKLAEGRHTVHERALLTQHLRDDDRVIELGGGIGMVAAHCARRLGPGRVTSFEGNPRMEDLIRENYALNGVDVDLHMAVVGPKAGSVTFYLAERFSHSAMTDNTGTAEAVEVPMQPWDDVHGAARPSVIVVDIQGGEVEFFREARLDGIRMILVEFHPPVTGLAPILSIRRRLRREGFAEATRSGTSHVYLRDL
ncbi:MAG: FkbM family methyltransferase [Pseudomonadota bacterium]